MNKRIFVIIALFSGLVCSCSEKNSRFEAPGKTLRLPFCFSASAMTGTGPRRTSIPFFTLSDRALSFSIKEKS